MRRLWWALGAVFLVARPAFSGFASTEEFLAAVGNPQGAGGAHFLTTVWITNVASSATTFTFEFLKTGQANNGSNTQFSETLQPGQTKVYPDVAGETLGLSNALGGARITANGELFVSERIFNQPSGTALSATAGQFFSGIPRSFSIGLGESAGIQGVYVGNGKDFRYNFVLLETSGAACTVHVQLLDAEGSQLGAQDYPLSPYEHVLIAASQLAPTASSDNARIVATVTAGAGTLLIAGSQVGNSNPQDQSGFEMSFPDSILGSGGGGSGVTSLNGLTGAVTLSPADSSISIGQDGPRTITVLATIAHDATLTGQGNASSPLGVAAPPSISHDSSLTGSGTGASPLGIYVPLSLTSGFDAVTGISSAQSGVVGKTTGGSGAGVLGQNTNGNIGELGAPSFGVYGASGSGSGVDGETSGGSGAGVLGKNVNGNLGELGAPSYAVYGKGGGNAIYGETTGGSAAGVQGHSDANGTDGYLGGAGYGVYGSAGSNANYYGVYGNGGLYAVYATNAYNGTPVTAYLAGSNDVGVEANGGIGVKGVGDSIGVYGDCGPGITCDAGYFKGYVVINGTTHTSGAGFVKFDDPADPANKTISHSFVGSSEMKNIYDGVATLGPTGSADVELPAWFESLNGEFRYQLTALGTPQAGLFVSKEIANNQFTIAGGVPGARVSWQVTGVRRDPWANQHPMKVEEMKTDADRGFYIAPELYGQPETKSMDKVARSEAQRAEAAKGSNDR